MRIDINQRGEFVLVDDSGNELQGAKHQLESLLDEFDNLPFVGNKPWHCPTRKEPKDGFTPLPN